MILLAGAIPAKPSFLLSCCLNLTKISKALPLLQSPPLFSKVPLLSESIAPIIRRGPTLDGSPRREIPAQYGLKNQEGIPCSIPVRHNSQYLSEPTVEYHLINLPEIEELSSFSGKLYEPQIANVALSTKCFS